VSENRQQPAVLIIHWTRNWLSCQWHQCCC